MIRFLHPVGGNQIGDIRDLGSTENARLVGLGLATYDLRAARSLPSNGDMVFDSLADVPAGAVGPVFTADGGQQFRVNGQYNIASNNTSIARPLITKMPTRITDMTGWTKAFGNDSTITEDDVIKLPDDSNSIRLQTPAASGGSQFQKAVELDLTGVPDTEFFTFVLHTDIRLTGATQQQCRFYFYSNGLPTPTNGYQSPWCQFHITNGVQQFSFRKSDFIQQGTGGWNTVLMRIEVPHAETQIRDIRVLGIFVGLKTRPAAILSFDDSTRDHYYYVHQAALARGVPVTYYMYQEIWTGNESPHFQMTRQQLEDIGKSGGGMLGVHDSLNWDGKIATLGVLGLRSYFQDLIAYCDQFSGTGRFFSWPEGNTGTGQANYEILRDLTTELFLSGRHVITSKTSFEQAPLYPQMYGYNYMSTRIGLTNLADASTIETAIDTAISRGETIQILGHKVAKTHSATTASIAVVEAVMDYLKTKELANLIDLETHASWYHRAQMAKNFTLDETLPI